MEVQLGGGDGTFVDPVPDPVGITRRFGAAGDTNRDGKLDVVLVSDDLVNGVASLGVLPGNGDGTLQPAIAPPIDHGVSRSRPRTSTGRQRGSRLPVHDRQQLVCPGPARQGRWDLPGRYARPATMTRRMGAVLDLPSLLAVADITSDGKPDVLISGGLMLVTACLP